MMKACKFLFAPAVVLILSCTHSSAQALEVDWLYLANNSSWISRSESLSNAETNLHLPVNSLTAEQFWWQSDNSQTQIAWAQPDPLGLPKKGVPVEIEGESGLWLVKESNSSHLVLQQGKSIRYWPQSQWHLLKWTSSFDYGTSLTVLQPEKSKSTLFYAWQTPDLSAQVRYRLDDQSGKQTLYQELIVSNYSDSDYKAPGYSFSQVTNRPIFRAKAMMQMEESFVSAPEADQSQGVPTLISNQPISLQAGSHVWLPVSETDLKSVERIYSLQWDSQLDGTQQAQIRMKLTASGKLPDLSGPIKVGVFDHQVALLESQYNPSSSKEATLNLGQSPLVTMTSTLQKEGQWLLSLENKTEDNAMVELMVSHWNGNGIQQIPMTVKIDANSSKALRFELARDGSIKQSK